MTIEERVRKLLVEYLGVEHAKTVPTAKLVDDLGADSIDLVTLIMGFEDEFEIEVLDEDAEKVVTVADMIAAATPAVPVP